MFDRRNMLLAGAGLLAGCASARAPAGADPEASAEADAAFRDLVDRMGERSRMSRPFLLRRFADAPLTAEGRILYEAVVQGAEADAALAQFAWGKNGQPYPVTHRNGAYRRAAEMRADDSLRIMLREVNRDTNRLEGHAARGVIAPAFLIDASIPAVEAAARRVSDSGGEAYEPLALALARQAETLRTLRARAGEDAGVWRLPNGEEYYALALQFHLGAAADARQAHARALDRCRALQAEAEPLLRARGLTQGTVGERLRALVNAPDERTRPDEASKAAAVAAMNARLAQARELAAVAIDGAANAPGQVRLLPAELEANGAQGRRQGINYLVDLGASRPLWTLPSVVHHEILPGHILQSRFEREARAPDLQLRYASGYSEGWSVYAEQLMDDLGAFEDEPLARLGHLHWMLFRAARVVADTGIHAMRWSRARAVEEMRALQGENIAFVSIEEDVLRFCAQPGAHAAQGLAAMHISDLRERTRRTQREGFDMRRFHAAMLRHGPLSPPGLDQAARAAFAAA